MAIQTLRDPVGIPETELRNKHTWTWDGGSVTAASYLLEAVGGRTGWRVQFVNGDYMGQTTPAPAIELFGVASFEFTGGLYRHEHHADVLVQGDGECTANFYFSGTRPGESSYLTRRLYIE